MRKRKILLSPAQTIALCFVAVILVGALLLMMPFTSRSGVGLSFVDSLFTATSATCVTGLVVVDTWTHFNWLGQFILLVLIQVGGLGYMTLMITAALLIGKKIGLRQRSTMMESISAQNLSDVAGLARYILFGTLAIEGCGAVLLALRFVPEMGFGRGCWYAVFHSISAFCNAGFDLMGFRSPFSSLTFYVEDPLVNLTVCALILLGGLGFMVWRDLWTNKFHFRKYSLHSKLMLVASAVLVLGGTILFWLSERNGVLADLSSGGQVLGALFQSVTARTAGFNTVDLASLSGSGSLLMLVLMFIGAGPGSTGGGVKITTVVVCLLSLFSYARGKRETSVFNRRLDDNQIKRSAAGVTLYFVFAMAGCYLLTVQQPFALVDALFEIFSALSTVGLTTGVTQQLNSVNKMLLILMMYAGRIGSLTMIMAVVERLPARVKDPIEHIVIG